jgi:hypothetical protein
MNKLHPYLFALTGVLIGGLIGFTASPGGKPAPFEPAPALEAPELQPPPPAPRLPATEPQPAEFDGEIRGLVRLESGHGLPGVEIRATPLLERADLPAASPEHELRAFAEHRLRELSMLSSAVSGADGSYRLTGLDSSLHYRLEAAREGYTFRAERAGLVTHYRVGSELDFFGVAAALVTAQVLMPDGSQAHAATIGISSLSGERRTPWYWTRRNTRHPVPLGTWQLQASAGDARGYRSEPVSISVNPGKAVESVIIQLRGRHGIVGRAIPPVGVADVLLRVQLAREVDGVFRRSETPDGAVRRQLGLFSRSGWTFDFLDLEPGRYRVELVLNDEILDSREVEVSDSVVDVLLTAPEPDINDYVVVHVSGPEGPISRGLDLSISVPNSRTTGGRALNRGNGEYWLPRRESSFAGDGGSYIINVGSPKYGRRSVEHDRHDRRPVTIVFDKATYLNVEIVGLAENEHREHLHVTIYRPGGRAQRGSSTGVGSGDPPFGPRRFGPLEPGPYTIELYAFEGRFSKFPLATMDVVVTPGENHVRFTPPELYSFTVFVPEEYRSEPNRVTVVQLSTRQWAITDAERGSEEFEARFLPAGDYNLWLPRVGSMKVSVPADHNRRIIFLPEP